MEYLFFAVALTGVVGGGAATMLYRRKISQYRTLLLGMAAAIALAALSFLAASVIGGGFEALLMEMEASILHSAVLSGISEAVLYSLLLYFLLRGEQTVNVFLTMGTVLPIVLGSVLYFESVGIKEWLGILLVLLGAVAMCGYVVSGRERFTPAYIAGLTLCTLALGCSCFSKRMLIASSSVMRGSAFNFHSLILSSVLLFSLYALIRLLEYNREKRNASKSGARHSLKKKQSKQQNNKQQNKERNKQNTGGEGVSREGIRCVTLPLICYTAVMALCVGLSAFGVLSAAENISSAVLFPTIVGASGVLLSLLRLLFKRERPAVGYCVGIFMTLVGLVVICI